MKKISRDELRELIIEKGMEGIESLIEDGYIKNVEDMLNFIMGDSDYFEYDENENLDLIICEYFCDIMD